MVDFTSFTLNLPSFIERSYFISPGVVSVIFRVIWSFFTFLVVTLLIQCGLGAAAIKEIDKKNNQKSLWSTFQNYNRVQSVSNGRWGSMILNLSSKRVLIGFLFWFLIYVFELLFSLSIDTSSITIYNGTHCIGRVDDFGLLSTTMWDTDAIDVQVPPKNITLLKELLNQKRAGNIALLGDGIFSISSADGLYTKNQTIKVARAGFDCDYNNALYLRRTGGGFIFKLLPSGEFQTQNLSTPHYSNITTDDLGSILPGYANVKAIEKGRTYEMPKVNNRPVFLIFASNPHYSTPEYRDINDITYNGSTILVSECTMFYEHGLVTIEEDGVLNEENIGASYVKVENSTLDNEIYNSSIESLFAGSPFFLTLYDYPNQFLNAYYNQTFPETMKTVNDIVAAHIINGLDQTADLCTFNQEQTPVYTTVLGTKMSFGYILVGFVFVVVTLSILLSFALMLFTKEERNRWLLFTRDWSFTGYISTGDNMDKKAFRKYAKSIHLKSNISATSLDKDIEQDAMLQSDSLLKKK